jgi:hypothetical protein
MLLTFADLVDHVLAFGGTDAARETASNHRRAVQNAMRVLPTRHEWYYFWGIGRVTTVSPYTTGTVAYTASSRTLTLTGGTWPTWAALGYVYLQNIPYSVESRTSGSAIVLAAAEAPASDIAGPLGYSLFRDRFPMPADLIAVDETVTNAVGVTLEFVHPRNWSAPRRTNVGPGQPRAFTLIGDRTTKNLLDMAIWPAPDNVYAIDFLYRRKPRALAIEREATGLASISLGQQTVTGTGTAFKSVHVGSVIRLAADNAELPTGEGGLNAAAFEATVIGVDDGFTLSVDTAATEDLDRVKYVISDPVDIFVPSMGDFLLREIEKQWRLVCRTTPLPGEREEYDMALTRAMEADNLSSERTAVYRAMSRRTRRIHWPFNLGA